MKRNLILLCVAIFTLSLMASAQSDLKIKKTSRMNMPGMPTGMKNPQTGEIMDPGKMPDTTVFIKGQRMLSEMRQESGKKKMIMSNLRQCDLNRNVSYNNQQKKYYVQSFSSGPSASTQSVKGKPVAAKEPVESGGTVTYTMAYTDTGERKQILGYNARHVKTTMTVTPSANACTKAMKMETDAWYIDLPTFSCPTFTAPQDPNSMGGDSGGGCRDKMIFKTVGSADNGFAVKETMTMFMDGQSFSIASEVIDISRTELDAQLFEIPAGYTEDKDSAKNTQNNTAQNNTYTPPQTPASTNATYTPQGPVPEIEPPLPTGDSLAPKRQGVIRVGIAKPVVKTPDSKDDTTAPMQLSAAIRDTLVEAIKGQNVEAIRLQTDAPEAEALEKECDYIFYANVTQKRGGGGMFKSMILMGAVSMAGAMVPGVGGMIASSVASAVMGQTMGKMAKAKDEFTLDYKVLGRDKAVLSQAVSKAKTKEDGEDVLTPQLKTASTAVLGEIAKKRTQ